jgi:hypothetical protein
MENLWSAIAALGTAFTALIVVLALLYARSQVREARLERNASLLRAFQDTYHAASMRQFRLRLLGGEFGTAETFDQARMTDADRLQYWGLVDELEFLGVLVDRGLLDFELVVAAFRYTPPQIWQHIRSYTMRQREVHIPPLDRIYLELLANRYNEYYLRHYGVCHPVFAVGQDKRDETGRSAQR